ncbi:beta-1,3-galactosyltransferase 2-like [Latimeria chalumnae]|uniref:beta-1,3-galactosyltransferase 2-like n=1 Tax=Latimeria chalumnae TaxID=7897 RepID=UPI00313ECC09
MGIFTRCQWALSNKVIFFWLCLLITSYIMGHNHSTLKKQLEKYFTGNSEEVNLLHKASNRMAEMKQLVKFYAQPPQEKLRNATTNKKLPPNDVYQIPDRYHVPYPHNYDYIINEPEKCKDKTPFLVFLIPTSPRQETERNAVRQTWGNETLINGVTIIRIFLVGLPTTNTAMVQERLEYESAVYHDVVQRGFLDTYNNLTIKTMIGIEWLASFCSNASYFMKVDVDMFVNTYYLVNKLLRSLSGKTNFMAGQIIKGVAVVTRKNSKWYIPPEIYPNKTYPSYCCGAGYVISAELAAKIVEISQSIKPLHVEDIYIGLCLKKLNVQIFSYSPLFYCSHVTYDRCRYAKLIMSHGFKPDILLRMWEDFLKAKHTCTL